ncbi:MAG: 8-oxo-dGTP diphosphatase [bacterium]|nr:8-oxo-dGTP diphosphatase [bacterium]
MKKVVLTLCLIRDKNKLLFGMKKRGFGEGRWNGFGGKVHEGETIQEAAIREVAEECGLTVQRLRKAGQLEFVSQGEHEISTVHVFSVEKFSGIPVETDEMKPRWFGIEEIPYKSMWPDDKYWLPLFLAGKKFHGRFLFDASFRIIEYELHEE